MMSVQANTGPSWEDKNTTAFWRGRDSRKERLELVKLSRKYPEIIDAAFTNFFFFKHDESLYGPIVKHISFFDFFKVSLKWGSQYFPLSNNFVYIINNKVIFSFFSTLPVPSMSRHPSSGINCYVALNAEDNNVWFTSKGSVEPRVIYVTPNSFLFLFPDSAIRTTNITNIVGKSVDEVAHLPLHPRTGI